MEEKQRLLGSEKIGGSQSGSSLGIAETIKKLSNFVTLVSQIEENNKDIGTRKDSNQLRTQLHERISYATKMAKELGVFFNTKPNPNDKSKFDQAFSKYNATLKKLATVTRASVDKENAHPLHSISRSSSSASSASASPMDTNIGTQQQQQQQIHSSLVADTTDVDRAIIEETNKEYRKLAQDMADLAETFAEARVDIGRQGEDLDTIEVKVDSGEYNIEEAVKQLETGYEYQKSARKKMLAIGLCIFFSVLIALGLAIFFIVRALKS